MANIDFNTDEWMKGFASLEQAVENAQGVILMHLGDELLRLSTFEIPHKDGYLQTSGEVDRVTNDEVLAGFNKVYAAYQHEGSWPDGTHVIRNHSKMGRKTKYLIDPLTHNTDIFEKYMGQTLSKIFS